MFSSVVADLRAAASPPSLHGSIEIWTESSAAGEPSSEDWSGGTGDTDRQRRAIDEIYDLDFWQYQLPGMSETLSSTTELILFTATVAETETLTASLTSGPAPTLTETLTSGPAPTLTETLTSAPAPTPSGTLTGTGSPNPSLTQTLTDMVRPTPTLTQTQTQTLTQTETGSLVDDTDTEKRSGAAPLSALWSIVLGLQLLRLSALLGWRC